MHAGHIDFKRHHSFPQACGNRMSTIWDAANSVTIVLIDLIYNTQLFYLHVDMSDTTSEYCRFKQFNNNKMQEYHLY